MGRFQARRQSGIQVAARGDFSHVQQADQSFGDKVGLAQQTSVGFDEPADRRGIIVALDDPLALDEGPPAGGVGVHRAAEEQHAVAGDDLINCNGR